MTHFDRDAEKSRLDAVAGRYAEASVTEAEADAYCAKRAAESVTGPAALVLGAATGAWIEPLIARLAELHMVDAVGPAVAHAVASAVMFRGRGARAAAAASAATPAAKHDRATARIVGHTALFEEFAPPRRFDTVVMGHVLEHVFDPVAVLARAATWLEPGGRIVILVPNAHSLHRLVGVELGLLPAPEAFSPGDVALGHRRVYTRDALTADVIAAGLRVEALTGLVLKPLSNQQMDAWTPALRAAYFALGDRAPELACVLHCVATPA